MTCQPDDLLAAAKSVGKIADTEALRRAIVSRAYYASFHRCTQYNAELPYLGTIKGTGAHEQLISQLMLPSPKLGKNARARATTIGKYLRELCTLRVEADYHLQIECSEHKAHAALQIADSIFTGTKVKKGPIPD